MKREREVNGRKRAYVASGCQFESGDYMSEKVKERERESEREREMNVKRGVRWWRVYGENIILHLMPLLIATY
jgi:hypothetical protein